MKSKISSELFIFRLDARLGDKKISSNELIEISGTSGSGKTYLCLKMASLALIDKDVAVIYIDTTNYLNNENVTISLKVILFMPLFILRTL